ncbi:ABC transporter substrate-binding protein [Bradyrhizobium sp. dw_411]|uniref:ABC transporter substrate-binding protein n=1 Tax=Bradyrhizobium sp. dw_411 TaxID=2720082 RepID=UPI001BD19760|nr:ABC transporter substrate-binding protein [Bradyrhizobium sp. dw_411]
MLNRILETVLRALSIIAVLAFGPVAIAADSANSSPDNLRIIRFGTVIGIGLPGVFAAVDQGYFRDEGLKLEITFLGGGPAIVSALVGGSLDIVHSDTLAWVSAVAGGRDLVMLASAHSGRGISGKGEGFANSLVINGDSTISKPSDLAGKVIAAAPAPLYQTALKGWLKANGVPIESITLQTATSVPALNGLLKARQVDAISSIDPFTQEGEKLYGTRIFATPFEVSKPTTAVGGLFTTSAFAKADPKTVEGFVRAARKGANYFLKASSAERARISEAYGQMKLSAIAKEVPDIVDTYNYQTPLSGPVDLEATQNWVDLATQVGSIPKRILIKDHLYGTASQ